MPTDGPDSLERDAARYRADIVAAVMRRTGDAELAADVAQETMLRVLARLRGDGLQDPSRLENFMYRVAANVLRESRRKDSRHLTDSDYVDGVESVSEDQFQHLARSEESRLMWVSLERISNAGYREILIRSFIRQEDKQHICKTLELSDKEYTNRLHRAKEALRRELTRAIRRHGLRSVE